MTVDEHVAQSAELLRSGRFREAEESARQALEKSSRHSQSLLILGVALAQQNRREEAIAVFREAIAESPDSAATQSNLGAALAEAGRFSEALPHCRRAVELRRDSIDYQANLVACLLRLERTAEATDAAERLVELDPRPERIRTLAACLMSADRHHQAGDVLQQLLSREPDDAANWFALSEAFEKSGREEQAIAACRRALEIAPDHPRAGIVLAQLLLRSAQAGISQRHPLPEIRRRREEAVQLLQSAKRWQATPETLLALGRALREAGQPEAALEELQQAVRLAPDNALIHDLLGELLSELGQAETAVEQFRMSIELAPLHTPAYFHLATTNVAAATEEDTAAIEELLQRDELEPPRKAFLHFALGRLYDRQSRWDEAFEQYQAGNILKPRPDDESRQDVERVFGEPFVTATLKTFQRPYFEEREDVGITSHTTSVCDRHAPLRDHARGTDPGESPGCVRGR